MKFVIEGDLDYYADPTKLVEMLRETAHALESLLPSGCDLREALNKRPDEPFRVLMETIPEELIEDQAIKARLVFMRADFDTKKYTQSTVAVQLDTTMSKGEVLGRFAEAMLKGEPE